MLIGLLIVTGNYLLSITFLSTTLIDSHNGVMLSRYFAALWALGMALMMLIVLYHAVRGRTAYWLLWYVPSLFAVMYGMLLLVNKMRLH